VSVTLKHRPTGRLHVNKALADDDYGSDVRSLAVPWIAHHSAAVTSNVASMTSCRPRPSVIPVSLVVGAPPPESNGDLILTMGRRPSVALAGVFAARATPGTRWCTETISLLNPPTDSGRSRR
jgi:hypothetical protein